MLLSCLTILYFFTVTLTLHTRNGFIYANANAVTGSDTNVICVMRVVTLMPIQFYFVIYQFYVQRTIATHSTLHSLIYYLTVTILLLLRDCTI